MSKWTKISIVLTVVLIGIPTSASFYPPIFAGLADQLPLNPIFTWMGRTGLISLGFLGGWWAREGLLRKVGAGNDEKIAVTEIEGCIQLGGSCWQGTAEISNEKISEIEVENRAICPNCQAIMYDGENGAETVTTEIGWWNCPNCDHQTYEEGHPHKDARKLFEYHARRIVETEGKEYSLDMLIARIDGGVTSRQIWEQYVDVVEDSQVSFNCFH